MKKFLQIACCALGGGMTGLSAGRLDSIPGIVLFIGGVALMVVSIHIITRPEKGDE